MQANELQKALILSFWDRFGGWKAKLKPIGSRVERMIALQEMSQIVIPYHKQTSLDKRRASFDEVKSDLCRQKIGSSCFVCERDGFNRHHIIQLQNGGINSRRNLVILCDQCHEEIHPWLKLKHTSAVHDPEPDPFLNPQV